MYHALHDHERTAFTVQYLHLCNILRSRRILHGCGILNCSLLPQRSMRAHQWKLFPFSVPRLVLYLSGQFSYRPVGPAENYVLMLHSLPVALQYDDAFTRVPD